MLPWEIDSDLTEERLRLIANTFRQVRIDALEGHEPDKGDDEWVFGCRSYARTCFAVAGLQPEHPWLTVTQDGLACTLTIGKVPVKFFRGDPADPSSKVLNRGVSAAIRDELSGQIRLFVPPRDDQAGDGWFWLFAIETRENGTVLRVVILQAHQTEGTRNAWEIPLEAATVAIAPVTPVRDGVELAPPEVGPKHIEELGDAVGANDVEGNRET